MKKRILIIISVLVLFFVSAQGAERIFTLETGPVMVIHSRGITNTPLWGGLVGGTYGFKVLDRGSYYTALSFLGGYEILLDNRNVLSATGLVYGLDFSHVFFAQKRMLLHVGYGLLINMVGLSSEKGFAYGHHTRLTVGTAWKTGVHERLGLDLSYSMVSFPNFNREKRNYGYGSIAIKLFFE